MKSNITIEEIREKLAQYKPELQPVPNGFKKASVLIPFYPQTNGLSVIFMKRPDYPGPHGGQISFPGGAKDESDIDDLCTALRETEEEIGIDRNKIEIIGGLKTEYTFASRYWITPYVGLMPFPTELKPDENEVERLIIIPFSHLLKPETFSKDMYEWKGFQYPSYLYTFEKDVIWGLTARILFNFISLLFSGQEASTHWPPA